MKYIIVIYTTTIYNLNFVSTSPSRSPDANTIIVRGVNKELVGQTAAVVRSKRPPEVYKGKGIKYAEEHIRRKEGKTGKK